MLPDARHSAKLRSTQEEKTWHIGDVARKHRATTISKRRAGPAVARAREVHRTPGQRNRQIARWSRRRARARVRGCECVGARERGGAPSRVCAHRPHRERRDRVHVRPDARWEATQGSRQKGRSRSLFLSVPERPPYEAT